MNIYSVGNTKILLVEPTAEELRGFQSYRRRLDDVGTLRKLLLEPISGLAYIFICMVVAMLVLGASSPPLALLLPIAIAILVPQQVINHRRYNQNIKQYNRMVDDDRALRFSGAIMVGLKMLLIKGGRELTQDQLIGLISSSDNTVKEEVGIYLTSRLHRRNLWELWRLRTEGARDYLRYHLLPGARQLLSSIDGDQAASMLRQNLVAKRFHEDLQTVVELENIKMMMLCLRQIQ